MSEPSAAGARLLTLSGIDVVYGGAMLALRGVSITVDNGQIVALLGANGAGKTTTLKAISNLVSVERGRVTKGSITYAGQAIQGRDPEDLVQAGIVQVLEGRRCFLSLTVEENLAVGANGVGRRPKTLIQNHDAIYDFFPKLAEHRKNRAGFLSGGEQQMLAIGRALLAQPKLLLLDEPSMGLAPQVVAQIFGILKQLNDELGLSILVSEQNAKVALRHADHAYVLANGIVVSGGPAADLAETDDIRQFYLGKLAGTAAGHDASPSTADVDWMA